MTDAAEQTELFILIDATSATKEKRMIAFNGEVEEATHKFIMSIVDFANFGVENAGADPVAAVDVISANLTRLIEEKHRKGELLPTTKLGAL